MEGTVVLYPLIPIGHLVSMVELAKLILHHYHHRFSVTVLILSGPHLTPDVTAFLHRASQANPTITFHYLTSPSLKPFPDLRNLAAHTEFIRSNNPNLHHALTTISKTSTIRALVIDFFCTPAFTVSSNLGIPIYNFITSGATLLSLLLYLPTIHNQTTKSFKDLGMTLINSPGLPPIPASHLPEKIQNREDQNYNCILEISFNLPKSKGIIVNTFEALESRVIKAIADGLCVPDALTPPVYCIGPLIASPENKTGEGECLSWLDAQPSRSVVFLCFGSMGVFSAMQLKEIAIGLEKSGQRFLWVVRKPVSEDNNKHISMEREEPDFSVLLPEGFLDRTKDRGLVVKSWAPQVEVLSRESVGGFVTHCGWNSVLEAVYAGVPMVAWPLYAEQNVNKALLVEDVKLALPMEESEDGLVSADEVEKRVRALMESEEGRELKERSRKMKEEALVVWSQGGLSLSAMGKLFESWCH